MAKEAMQLGEGFSAQKISSSGSPPPVKPRHAVIGWAVVLALFVSGGLWFWRSATPVSAPAAQETVGLSEAVNTGTARVSGVLNIDVIHDGIVVAQLGPFRNQIVNAGETALRDCFGGTGTPTCTAVQNFKFHGIGTSSTAITEGDTGCGTELTTQYNPDNTRATGSQTNNGANVYRTVGTNTVDAAVTIQEFCLMSQAATGGGTMWTRILTGGIALSSGDSLQTTYDLTIE